MGYDLRRCNFSTFSSLFCKFGCILVPPGQMLDHFIVLCLCTRFFHPGSVYMLSTQQRIQQLEMKFFRRKRPALLFLRNISEFAIAQIPLLLLHNQRALIKFRTDMRTDKMTLMVQDNNRKRQANNREALNTRLR